MSQQDQQDPSAPKKTVLGASGAAAQVRPDDDLSGMAETFIASGDGSQMGVADTFVAPGGLDAAGRPITGPPDNSHRTVLGASGAAQARTGAGRMAITAPEIGTHAEAALSGLAELPAMDPEALVGMVVADRYRILRLLGQGGMGVVYLAEHVVIEKRVALKVLNEELTHSRDAVSRFIYEAKAASKIGHENIVDITDFGTMPQGGVFFVMEFLDGTDLSDRLKADGRIPWEQARRIGNQMCRALSAAHGKGITHRDLKPENVFLIKQGGRDDFVKILDFGIAKFTGMDAGAPKQTKTGMIFGTPDYMAPEQAEGRKADHRVDIYALGIILYQLVTGRLPFEAETFMGVLHQHMTKMPTPPRELEPGLPPGFEAVILRALEKDPDQRYQTMQEVGEALKAIDANVVTPAPALAPAPEEVLHKTSRERSTELVTPMEAQALAGATPTRERKGRGLWIGLGIAAVLALAGGAFLIAQKRGAGEGNEKTSEGTPPAPPRAAAPPPDAQAPPPRLDAQAPPVRPATPRDVKLRVVTRPARAEVILDGVSKGKTPIRELRVPFGTEERLLQIRRRGYRTVEIRFVPDANQSWERVLEPGRGVTRVAPMPPVDVMRPPPVDVMRPPPVDVMRPPPVDVMRPLPMDVMRPPPMGVMRPSTMDLKDPFGG